MKCLVNVKGGNVFIQLTVKLTIKLQMVGTTPVYNLEIG